MNGISTVLYEISIWALPVIFAVTFHEASHGFVALRFGDDTALQARRLTFNPLNHIDRFGTIILPALLWLGSGGRFLFGYAKPVPVNFARLYNPRRDMVWVAIAGPAMNVLLAIASSLLIHGVPFVPSMVRHWMQLNLENSIVINILLCVFNMLPLPPLDGGRVAVGLLPRALALPLARLERYGILIVLLVLFVMPWLGERIGYNLDVVPWVIGWPAEVLYRFVMVVTGQGG